MEIDNKVINALRVRAVSMIENAKSGHPGIALDIAPMLYTLYAKVLNVCPKEPNHLLRDRFVLSAGHGSSILYSTLSAMGYDISVKDLKNFRKLNSKTPGHPEMSVTPGVDFGTGPLGQGVSTAVGMALAERIMASRYNKPDCYLFDNYTYALVGDGCLMEGVSHEALSLAGSLKLNKLIVLYDFNGISIEGEIAGTFEQDTAKVMQGYGFNVLHVDDGNDIDAIEKAINTAKKSIDKPSFIMVKTIIGYGSHMQGIARVHGTPLGEIGIEQLKKNLNVKCDNWDFDDEINAYLVKFRPYFDKKQTMLNDRLGYYKKHYKKEYAMLMEQLKCDGTDTEWLKSLVCGDDISLRDAGGKILNAVAQKYNFIIGGSADVGPSTKTMLDGETYVSPLNYNNKLIKYGVREFGMSAVSNGLACYGGFKPFCSTFFVFSDYMKNGIRMSALQNLDVTYIFTHDSIAVGEDGPTHHAVEQLWGLRSIPNLRIFRPADFNECKACWSKVLEEHKPSAFVLCRQKVPFINGNWEGTRKGGYIIKKETREDIDAILIATGSEVSFALKSAEMLEKSGYSIRVVSMPCTELFDAQTSAYKEKILPSNIRNRVAVELGSDCGWYKYVGLDGGVFGINHFGKSANYEALLKYFNYTPEALASMVKKIIKKNK